MGNRQKNQYRHRPDLLRQTDAERRHLPRRPRKDLRLAQHDAPDTRRRNGQGEPRQGPQRRFRNRGRLPRRREPEFQLVRFGHVLLFEKQGSLQGRSRTQIRIPASDRQADRPVFRPHGPALLPARRLHHNRRRARAESRPAAAPVSRTAGRLHVLGPQRRRRDRHVRRRSHRTVQNTAFRLQLHVRPELPQFRFQHDVAGRRRQQQTDDQVALRTGARTQPLPRHPPLPLDRGALAERRDDQIPASVERHEQT